VHRPPREAPREQHGERVERLGECLSPRPGGRGRGRSTRAPSRAQPSQRHMQRGEHEALSAEARTRADAAESEPALAAIILRAGRGVGRAAGSLPLVGPELWLCFSRLLRATICRAKRGEVRFPLGQSFRAIARRAEFSSYRENSGRKGSAACLCPGLGRAVKCMVCGPNPQLLGGGCPHGT
jgi:hypothetical protein